MSFNARLALLHPRQLKIKQSRSAFTSNFKCLLITHRARAARRPFYFIFHPAFSFHVLTKLAA